ncbi:MAG: type II toxin-antitoxin system Phd/YefM family antitoxin [Woronichinia naegeliana WA131]|jgi:PHD/YefM family antitoxin component YafN of YafNO toxin-antitoxin module|uniref:Type II toxin-antitoxin system Phd/YefM family antitoxin n=1 Tax=Woronichinia naegeliana WA131 TaxID=2824559 RepID=A0A977PUM1_9CYAN|nr:MAG: type II toxin-antitoxin system Phd/YefM family antitoxin [Woronichinia naegeliana WA131]
MYQVTVDYAKANLEELCDRTEKEPDGVAIIRENRSYILITQEKWESFYSCKTRYGE